MKCIMIVDPSLPTGLIANATAALGLSLGNHINGLIGPDILDGRGNTHKGITAIPIPILCADKGTLKDIYTQSLGLNKDLTAIGFTTQAQGCNSYDAYISLMEKSDPETLEYLGLCVYGPRKIVSRLSGQLKLLR